MVVAVVSVLGVVIVVAVRTVAVAEVGAVAVVVVAVAVVARPLVQQWWQNLRKVVVSSDRVFRATEAVEEFFVPQQLRPGVSEHQQ
jgi:hypothetical protein